MRDGDLQSSESAPCAEGQDSEMRTPALPSVTSEALSVLTLTWTRRRDGRNLEVSERPQHSPSG